MVVSAVAAKGESEQPAPEGRIPSRGDVKRRVFFEQPPKAFDQIFQRVQGQDVAGQDDAAVPPGASMAEAVLFDHRHRKAEPGEVVGGGGADDAAADDGNGFRWMCCLIQLQMRCPPAMENVGRKSTKYEYRNSKQARNPNDRMTETRCPLLFSYRSQAVFFEIRNFGHSGLFRNSCFEFRNYDPEKTGRVLKLERITGK
jgi:hypothetical protein